MPTVNDWQMDTINTEDLSATDLRQECEVADAAGDTGIHCYELIRLDMYGSVVATAQMVYFADYGRAGIAWGGDAQWTDCSSAEEAVRRWTEDDMSN